MSEKGKQGAIIVVRKKGGHGGHHGGAWKVAYADFVTAMMAFFMVMWIVGQSQKVKQNVAGYFTDPAAYSQKVAAGLLDGGAGVMTASGPAIEPAAAAIAEQAARAALAQAGQEILEALGDVPGLAEVADQIEVEVTSEGLRIQMMEGDQSTFFDLGSAKLSAAGVKMVSTIARIIGPLHMDVAVEGHTDSHPFGSANGYTNWELSADRANAARRLLEVYGVDPKRVSEIRGYADTKLRFPGNPEDPRNRRISIIVFSRLHQDAGAAAAVPASPPAGLPEGPPQGSPAGAGPALP